MGVAGESRNAEANVGVIIVRVIKHKATDGNGATAGKSYVTAPHRRKTHGKTQTAKKHESSHRLLHCRRHTKRMNQRLLRSCVGKKNLKFYTYIYISSIKVLLRESSKTSMCTKVSLQRPVHGLPLPPLHQREKNTIKKRKKTINNE